MNEHVWGFLDREEFRLAGLTAGLRGVNERACSLTVMSEFRKELAVTPYPLDPDIAAAVLAARRNDVIAIDDLAVEMADHFADQVMHEEGSWVSAYQRLKRAVRDLCCSGLVKRGWCVNLGPSPIEFLANPPLIDGVWIDQAAGRAGGICRVPSREKHRPRGGGSPSAGSVAAPPQKRNSRRT